MVILLVHYKMENLYFLGQNANWVQEAAGRPNHVPDRTG